MQLYCRQVGSLFAAAFLKAQLVIAPHWTICIYLNYFNFIKMILQLSIICFPPTSSLCMQEVYGFIIIIIIIF